MSPQSALDIATITPQFCYCQRKIPGGIAMRTFLLSAVVAGAIAVCSVFALNFIQENVDVAYTTIGAKI
jgi:hypothetical protein